MKKSQIRFPDRPNEIFEMLVIKNDKELLEYAEFKQNRFADAFYDILYDKNYNPMDVMNVNESSEKRLLKMFHRDNDLVSSGQIAMNKVIMGMLKNLHRGMILLVNEAGGYNVKREGEFEIVGEVEESYPNIKKGINSNYLVIENAPRISPELERILNNQGIDSFNIITNLKSVPINILQRELGVMIISGLKEIIFESQLSDQKQIDSIAKLLNNLPKMTLRVLTSSPEKLPETKHNIILHSYRE